MAESAIALQSADGRREKAGMTAWAQTVEAVWETVEVGEIIKAGVH